MRTGVVIVTWNSARHIDACLAACVAHLPPPAGRILVVDNASSDDTVQRASAFESVQVIANQANAGFAGAMNQGFRELADCDVVIMLNPDAQIAHGIAALADAARQPGVGAAGGLLVDHRGHPQVGFCVRRFPTPLALCLELLAINRMWPGNPVNRRYRCLDLDLSRPAEVDQPAGALIAVNRNAWSHVEGLCEEFHPLWFEDVDFMKRLRASGYRVLYVPDAKAVHAGGHSLESLDWGDRQLYWYGSLLRYTSRHFNRLGRWMVSGAVVLGAAPRAVTGMFRRRSLRMLGVYGQVLRLAAGFLRCGRIVPGRRPMGARCAGGVHSET